MRPMETQKVGITECGDPAFSDSWIPWCKEGLPAILITKHPGVLHTIIEKEFPNATRPNIIVHATITGWGGTPMEPNVPDMQTALFGFQALKEEFGPQRTVLRVDPIILTAEGVLRAHQVFKTATAMSLVQRARISFADMYPHVLARFHKLNIRVPHTTFHAPLELREMAWRSFSIWGKALWLPDICGEPDMLCVGCVSELDCKILGVFPKKTFKKQRDTCACCGNKHQLLADRKRCPSQCAYCYWKDA